MAVPQGIDVPFRMFKQGRSPNVVEGDAVLDRSIRTIIQTFPGERPYRPTFGSFARAGIFSNMGEGTAMQIGDEIRRAVAQWEPRVRVIEVAFELEDTSIFLTITWQANGSAAVASTVMQFEI